MDEPVTVYSRTGCVQCVATRRALDAAGIPYTVVDLDADPTTLDRLKTLGYRQAPVVEAPFDAWTGFRPDKINELIRRRLTTRGDRP